MREVAERALKLAYKAFVTVSHLRFSKLKKSIPATLLVQVT